MDADVKARFVELAKASLYALLRILETFHWSERAAYKIAITSEPDFGLFLRNATSRPLCETEEFQSLLSYVLSQPVLCDCIIAGSSKDLTDKAHRAVFRTYAQLVLARAICIAGAASDVNTAENMLQQFFDFLFSGIVKRKVTVPLIHVKLGDNEYDLEDFGTLESLPDLQPELVPVEISRFLFSKPSCQLTLRIETQRFLSAQFFPVGEMLRLRVAVLRLAVDPLISYNHFYVEHVRPWETPLLDSDFHSRFWSQPDQKVEITARLFTDDHVQKVRELWAQFDEMNWNSVTPWRLALNRLDDAIFKLESGSPDAIMDLVIGLESIFVEPESRQESTYKVATRVARFLEADEVGRKEVFRQAKELYKLRSKLAHGQPWAIDSEGITKVETAAILLGRVLSKMLKHKETTLNLLSVDLL